jgi:uncharacterized protein (UPF0128 family)
MFELYEEKIPLDDQVFAKFVSQYFQKNNVNDPEMLPYPELYAHVRKAIREFLHLNKSGGYASRSNK